MTDDTFSGSDETLGCGELPHVQTVTFDEPLDLTNGGRLPSVTVAYETYGTLNADRSNAVLICHALTGDSHVAAHDANDTPGWWDILVGPGKAIDTDELFVICPNVLGGCRGTTGPNSINPETNRPWGPDFPNIRIGDMVEVQRRLVDHLGVKTLLAVIGGSMGGHQTLCWARRYGDRVRGVVALATSPRLTSQSLAFDIVGRNAILHDPHYHDGHYYHLGRGPVTGLAIARMLGHITYLSPQAMSQKFEATRNQPRDVDTQFEKEFSVGSYLAYKGQQFTERFDANSYLVLSMAMDQYDLGGTLSELSEQFADNPSRWLVASFSSDWLFPPEQSREIVNALIRRNKPVSYCGIASTCGHDAFLLEDDLDIYGPLVEGFLDTLLDPSAAEARAEAEENALDSTNIFHHTRRLDYDRIVDLIPPDSSVLDLGCGHGGLLARLKQRGHQQLQGVELDERNILTCVRRGLDVVQTDLNKGLRWFDDGQFDYVLLSQTLQAVRDVEDVMNEMLRVGQKAVVSVPNFAYGKLVERFLETGRMPAAGLLHHHWYNTPNIRFLTLLDFQDFCRDKGIRIHRQLALNLEAGRELSDHEDANRDADLAIFVVSR